MNEQAQQAVVELEKAFWREGGGNPDFWAEHFAEHGLVTLGFAIMDKTQTVEAMASADAWAEFSMDDLHTTDLTDSSAVVTYRVTARRAADTEPYRAMIGSVYVRNGGTWRLAFHQQTPTGQGGSAAG